MKTIEKIIDNLKDIIESNDNIELYERIVENRNQTQKKFIHYRKVLSFFAIIYLLSILNFFKFTFIDNYIKIDEIYKILHLSVLDNLIFLIAPVFFSFLYYLMILSKFHRGILNVVIDSYNKHNPMLHFLTHSFSFGLVRGFLFTIKKNSSMHKNYKNTELYLYIITIVLSIFFMLYISIIGFNNYNIFIVLISLLLSLLILFILNRDIKKYKKFKKKFKKTLNK